jgi:hypothetical protein
MVKICQTGLLKSNFETRPKKRIFRFLPKISAGHGWSLKFFFANFQILGPLGCQGWVVIPQNVKKSQNHCTLMHTPSCVCNPDGKWFKTQIIISRKCLLFTLVSCIFYTLFTNQSRNCGTQEANNITASIGSCYIV